MKPLCINVAEFANYTCSTQTIKYVHVNIEKALYHIYSSVTYKHPSNQMIYSTQTIKYVHVNIENASSFKSGDIKTEPGHLSCHWHKIVYIPY